MTKQKLKLSIKILSILFGIIVLLVSLHLLFQYLNLEVYGELNGRIFEISNRLDLDDEASLGTWVAQFIFLGISFSAFLSSILNKHKPTKNLWKIVGIIGLLMAIDEVAAIHELILQVIHLSFYSEAAPTIVNNAWWILLPLVFIVSIWLIFKFVKLLPRKTVYQFIFGSTVFLFGAIIIDIITGTVPKNTYLSQGILVAVEESLELIGSGIIFFAIISYIEENYKNVLLSSTKRLSD